MIFYNKLMTTHWSYAITGRTSILLGNGLISQSPKIDHLLYHLSAIEKCTRLDHKAFFKSELAQHF